MKKKIFGAALVVALAVAAGWNFNQSKNETALSELGMANVEALARGEIASGYAYKDCINQGGNISCTCTGSGKILFCM